MILKKKLFQVPYSKFKCFNFIYEDEEDLKSNLLILIKSLIKHEYIVKVFSKDEVNYYFTNYLKKHSYNNFNYYLLKDISVFEQIQIQNLRFINIYMLNSNISYEDENLSLFKNIEKKSDCLIIFDNYLEVSSLYIDFSKYDETVLKMFFCV